MSLIEFNFTRNTQKHVINEEGFLENVGDNVIGAEYQKVTYPLFTNYLATSDLSDEDYYERSSQETTVEGEQSFPIANVDGYKITAPAAAPINMFANYSNIFKSPVEENSNVCFSFYAKSGTAKQVTVGANDYSNLNNYLLQLDFNNADPLVNTPFGAIDSGSEELSNGWYRFYVSFDIGAIGQFTDIAIIISSAFGGGSEPLSNGRDMYFAGFQLNLGTLPATYEDPLSSSDEFEETYSYRGILIEPASTNLFTYSENFDNAAWVKNASGINHSIGNFGIQSNVAISPAGNLTADRVNFINQNNDDIGLIKIVSSGSAGNSFSSYFYIKGEGNNIGKDITIKIKRDSGGSFVGQTKIFTLTDKWQRVGVNLTLTAGNIGTQTIISSGTSGATSCLLWGAQLEQKPEPTSYIKTTSSAVTRNADVIRLTNSDIYTPNEGQVVFEWEQQETDTLNVGLLSATVEAGVRRLKFIYTSTEQKLYIDDVLVDSITGNYDWSGMDKIEIGNFNGEDQPTTYLRLFAINENTV